MLVYPDDVRNSPRRFLSFHITSPLGLTQVPPRWRRRALRVSPTDRIKRQRVCRSEAQDRLQRRLRHLCWPRIIHLEKGRLYVTFTTNFLARLGVWS